VLGKAGETSGKVSSQTRFASHDLIELRVDASGSAPGVEIRATWLDKAGRVLGSEMHRSRIGQGAMIFPSPTPAGLEPGDYRVQVRVGGEMVSELHFTVEPRPQAASRPS